MILHCMKHLCFIILWFNNKDTVDLSSRIYYWSNFQFLSYGKCDYIITPTMLITTLRSNEQVPLRPLGGIRMKYIKCIMQNFLSAETLETTFISSKFYKFRENCLFKFNIVFTNKILLSTLANISLFSLDTTKYKI